MVSMIDPTKPTTITAYTADVRGNFARAKTEIEALQAQAFGGPFIPLTGGQMTGPLLLSEDAIDPMQAITLRQANSSAIGGPFLPLTGGVLSGDLTAPIDHSTVVAPNSSARRSMAQRAGDWVNVADFWAANRVAGVTDDSPAWQAAYVAATQLGGATITAPMGTVSLVTSNLTVTTSNIRFHLPSCTLLMSGAAITRCIEFAGTTTAGPTLAADAPAYTDTIQVSALNGLVAGSYIALRRNTVVPSGLADSYTFVGLVRGVSGTGPYVIQLNTVLPFAISVSDPSLISIRLLPLENVGVSGGVVIDGTAATNTGAVHGVYANSTVKSVFRDIKGVNISNGSIVFGFWGWHNSVEHIEGVNCGSQNTAAVQLNTHCNSQLNHVLLEQCSGFGVVLSGWSYGTGSGFIIEGCYGSGRGWKCQSTLFCNFSNFSSHFNHSNGVAVAVGSCYNVFSGISSNGNLLTEGVWLSDQNNCNNIFVGINAFGNTTRDLYIGATDLNNQFYGLNLGVLENHTTTSTFFTAGQAPNTTFPTINVTGTSTFGSDTGGQIFLNLDSAAGNPRVIRYNTAGLPRWSLTANSTAETGGNLGSDFTLGRWDDAGAALNVVLSIARSTGAATWANDVRVNGGLTAHGGFALFNTAMVTVQPTVTGAIGGNPALASLIAALASYGLFINNTTA